MTGEELRFRRMQLNIRVEEYHAMRDVYLISFPYPEWQTKWGTEMQYGVIVSKATGNVMSASPEQAWMEGRSIQFVKEWVWSYRGMVMCDTDSELQSPDAINGTLQRIPIKRMVYRQLADKL